MKPIGQNILVKPLPADDMTEGGIIVPDIVKKRGTKAKVIAVGNGDKRNPMLVPVGVNCWHVLNAGTEIEENGELFVLMHQQNILGFEVN